MFSFWDVKDLSGTNVISRTNQLYYTEDGKGDITGSTWAAPSGIESCKLLPD